MYCHILPCVLRLFFVFQFASSDIYHSAISPACRRHSLTLWLSKILPHRHLSLTHSYLESANSCFRCNVSAASLLLSSPSSLYSPLLDPPHDDTCSAAEIKGSALITNSTKCRPAAQGIRPHYRQSMSTQSGNDKLHKAVG